MRKSYVAPRPSLTTRAGELGIGCSSAKLEWLARQHDAGLLTQRKCVELALRRSDGSYDALMVGCIRLGGTQSFVSELSDSLRADPEIIEFELQESLRECSTGQLQLSGAEALALFFAQIGLEQIIAYPGTSELAVCDAISRTGKPKLVNGRGDAESVFAASGACAVRLGSAAAVLHGARGITNAMGSIAHARRNEIGVIVILGMCSESTQPFLPPHAESNLLESIKPFAKTVALLRNTDRSGLPSCEGDRERFLLTLFEAFDCANTLPRGPVVVGIRQNVAEHRSIELDDLVPLVRCQKPDSGIGSPDLRHAVNALHAAKRVVILIDDFALSSPTAREYIKQFAQEVSASILQVAYRRGSMLFERLTSADTPRFVGVLEQSSQEQRQLLEDADLLVTLEDRNMYARVVGYLPTCRKLALTSNPEMTCKNGYLSPRDVVLQGDISHLLLTLIENLRSSGRTNPLQSDQARMPPGVPLARDSGLAAWSSAFTDVLCEVLSEQPVAPIIVDDSQMLGGLVAATYESLPAGTRVIGDHSGFVGAGIAVAAGVALVSSGTPVWCLVGDQGFGNGFQALVFIGEQQANVKILLCNNGRSVSLAKQALASDKFAFVEGRSKFLANAPNLDCVQLARALGVPAVRVAPPENGTIDRWREAIQVACRDVAEAYGPRLIELLLPSELSAWGQIWSVKGQDE